MGDFSEYDPTKAPAALPEGWAKHKLNQREAELWTTRRKFSSKPDKTYEAGYACYKHAKGKISFKRPSTNATAGKRTSKRIKKNCWVNRRRLFPGRDSPVLIRLLQEIREANEKFNASH